MHRFLEKVNLRTLSDESRDKLDKDLTEEEIQKTISQLAWGKAPGIDGFPIESYKAFLPKLIKPLSNMLKHAIETGKLPGTLEQALVMVQM